MAVKVACRISHWQTPLRLDCAVLFIYVPNNYIYEYNTE